MASPGGGSALLLECCRKGLVEGIVSRLILLEAERNIRKKLPPSALNRFHRILEEISLHVVAPPTPEEVRLYQGLIHEKDAPILAAAIASRATHLVTLDQRHFMTEKLRKAHLLLSIVTPRDFFQAVRLSR